MIKHDLKQGNLQEALFCFAEHTRIAELLRQNI